MFRRNNAIFREYTPSLKPFYNEHSVHFAANISQYVDKIWIEICVFSNILQTLCVSRIITYLGIKYLKYLKHNLR
jgi:hypothetical protein